jgi:hypothetical protein
LVLVPPRAVPGPGPENPAAVVDAAIEELVVLVQWLGGRRDGGYSLLPARCPGCGGSWVGHRLFGYLLERSEVSGKLIGRPA